MKKYLFLAMALSMGSLVACGDDSSSGPSDPGSNVESSSSTGLSTDSGNVNGGSSGSNAVFEGDAYSEGNVDEKNPPNNEKGGNENSGNDEGSENKKGSENDEDSGNKVSDGDGTKLLGSESVKAFFPTGYNASDVAAWFATDPTTKYENSQTTTNVTAFYFFKDSSFIATVCELNVKTDVTTYSMEISYEGTLNSSSGNFNNGSFELRLKSPALYLQIDIQNGTFNLDPENSRSPDFKLMESAVPEAKDAVEDLVVSAK